MKKKEKSIVKIALFNHKGGVGKTTLTINIVNSIAEFGYKVLIVDADPQCNISAFYLDEEKLDKILGESNDEDIQDSGTIWSSIKPVVNGRGDIKKVKIHTVKNNENIFLIPGDVYLSNYEEELPTAWTDSFARKTRGYDVLCAISKAINLISKENEIDIVFYDIGPNVGALNRAIILDCDYFITPVCADLFSLRALTTVGTSISKWVENFKTIKELSKKDSNLILNGRPQYIGYISSAFKVNTGDRKALPHDFWENKMPQKVTKKVIDELKKIDPFLVQKLEGKGILNKIGAVKHFHSLAPLAQKYQTAIANLQEYANPGHKKRIEAAHSEFNKIAKEILKRIGL